MQLISLKSLPNQQFSIILDGHNFDLAFRYSNGSMVASIGLDNAPVVENVLIATGIGIIPAQYLEHGNFLLVTQNSELPDYNKFGVTQNLYYFSADELAAIRAPQPARITVAYFNPLGALPLRFSPQGYT